MGKLKTQTNENGTSTTYTYNQDRGWPTQILHKLGSTPFASYDLVYDGANDTVGVITKVTELDSSEVDYTYDALYRLTAETRSGTGAYTRGYGYDLAGNMTTYGGSTFAVFDDANKISTLSGGSINYDADGNLTGLSGTGMQSLTLMWDTRSRLVRQQTTAADLTFGYHASGRRVLRQQTGISSTNRFYVFSNNDLIGEVDAGIPSVAYTWAESNLISRHSISANESRWYHFGPSHETRDMTDNSGAITNSYRYDGYGNLLSMSGAGSNAYRYGGRGGYYSEDESGLALATNRWYAPPLKIWISRDPIGYLGSDNLYQYMNDNPIGGIDASGLDPTAGIAEALIRLDRHGGDACSAWTELVSERMGKEWEALTPKGKILREAENYLWARCSVQERGGGFCPAFVEGVFLVPAWQLWRRVENFFGYETHSPASMDALAAGFSGALDGKNR